MVTNSLLQFPLSCHHPRHRSAVSNLRSLSPSTIMPSIPFKTQSSILRGHTWGTPPTKTSEFLRMLPKMKLRWLRILNTSDASSSIFTFSHDWKPWNLLPPLETSCTHTWNSASECHRSSSTRTSSIRIVFTTRRDPKSFALSPNLKKAKRYVKVDASQKIRYKQSMVNELRQKSSSAGDYKIR